MARLKVKALDSLFSNDEVQVHRMVLAPGEEVPWHFHSNIRDTFYVIEGSIRLFLREPKEEVRLGPGESYCVGVGRPITIALRGPISCGFRTRAYLRRKEASPRASKPSHK